MLIISIVLAVLPTIIILRWIRNSDRFPEPWPVVRKVFWRGVWIAVPVVLIELLFQQWLPDNLLDKAAYMGFVAAAVPEELFKYLVLVFFCVRLSEFDEPIDGMVYGVTVSLGFATLENILYVYQAGYVGAISRAITAVPAHALMGAIMGSLIAMSLIEPLSKKRYYILALLVPVALHGAYDFSLMYMAFAKEGTGAMLVLLVSTIALQWYLALLYKKKLKTYQDETHDMDVICHDSPDSGEKTEENPTIHISSDGGLVQENSQGWSTGSYIGLLILSFFIPLFGWIYGGIKASKSPSGSESHSQAKHYVYAGIAGVALNVIIMGL